MGMSSGYFLPGVLDEIRLYDRPLSLAEIVDDMTRPVDPATPLEVTAVSPAAGELGVRSRPIAATFGVAMEPTSLTASTLPLCSKRSANDTHFDGERVGALLRPFTLACKNSVVRTFSRADRRVFPTIDIQKSGTRKEEMLMPKDDLNRVYAPRADAAVGGGSDGAAALEDEQDEDQRRVPRAMPAGK